MCPISAVKSSDEYQIDEKELQGGSMTEGYGENGTEKMVQTKSFGQHGIGQNGMDKIV